MSKRIIALLLVCLFAIGMLSACGSDTNTTNNTTPNTDNTNTDADTNTDGDDATNTEAPAANDPHQIIMFAHWYAEDHPQHQAALKFKELLDEYSGGSLELQIYPNSQLGSEDTFIDSVKQGTVQMGATGTMIAKYDPVIYAEETPFLFEGWDDAKEVLTGDLSHYITDDFEAASGMKIAAITVNGFRQFSSNKTMNSIEEFEGQRIRVPNVPNYIEMVEALGASPIAMSLTDLFTALEQNSVDGQDNPYPTDWSSSFYEVQDYILESNHMFSPANWVINANFYNNTLTDAQREAFDKAIAEAAEYNWEISEQANEEAKQNLIDAGVEITVPDEAYKAQLQEAMEPVYEWYFSEVEGSEEFIKAVWEYQGKEVAE